MIGNRPPRQSGSGSEGPDRTRDQKARARQAAEALFAQKPPPPTVQEPAAHQLGRQPRNLKHASPVARAPTDALATPTAAIRPPHVARIRAWLKSGMTIAQVANAYRIPLTEVTRLLDKP
jgi:hypothetical protein